MGCCAARRCRPPAIGLQCCLGPSIPRPAAPTEDDIMTTPGSFIRSASKFRNWITADGAPGPSGEGGFRAEPGRYHLYVSLACPWAHRTLMLRKLKLLEGAISVSVVEPVMSPEGWAFSSELPDHVNGYSHLHQLYTKMDLRY